MTSHSYPSVVLFHTLPTTMNPPRFSAKQTDVRRKRVTDDVPIKQNEIIHESNFIDVQDTLAQLDFVPDVLIGYVDTTRALTPINIKTFAGPKVLLIQDTHHGLSPLSWIIDYLQQEPYDIVVVMNRQHGHVIASMTPHHRVYWIPSLLIEPRVIAPPLCRQEPLVMVGQLAEHHPYRRHIVSEVVRVGFPLRLFQCPQTEVAKAYNQAQAALNVSLNGDLNFRVFEVTAAASLLITDQLSSQAGLERLFTPGVHIEIYRDSEDLQDILRRVLADPDAAETMARAGHEHYQQTLNRSLILNAFWDLVLTGIEDSRFTLHDDPRIHRVFKPETLVAYEALQQLQQQTPPHARVLLQDTEATELRDFCQDLHRLSFITPEPSAHESPSAFYDGVIIPDGSTARQVAKILRPQAIILESPDKKPAFSPIGYDNLPSFSMDNVYERQKTALEYMVPQTDSLHTDFFKLWDLLEHTDFTGKRVLEIGYQMHPHQASVLAKGVLSWTAVAEDPLLCQENLEVGSHYRRLNLSIQEACSQLREQFDLVVSFGVLQRTIPQEILDSALPLLAPGGSLFVVAWPLWTGADGWRESAPLTLSSSFPPELGWRHLLSPPAEQYNLLKAIAGPEEAPALARLYQASPRINRLFPAAYDAIFSRYSLEEKNINLFLTFDPNESMQKTLQEIGYPAGLVRWRGLFLKGKKPL